MGDSKERQIEAMAFELFYERNGTGEPSREDWEKAKQLVAKKLKNTKHSAHQKRGDH